MVDNKNYISKKYAMNQLGLSSVTLLKLVKDKKIEYIYTTGGHRRYNVGKYINDNKIVTIDTIKKSPIKKLDICYVRVSTISQKDDLSRQRNYMHKKYPDYKIIEDIGSGINFNRKGLRTIIKYAIAGMINTVIVAYKDRLTRFGFELIEDLIIEYSNGRIIIDNNNNIKKEPREELVEDVMQILNVYTAKMNGLRKYGKI
jgi:putative resolvase